MTINLPPRQRLGFRSKTPTGAADTNPHTAARRGWGSVTRHQISGWRFQIRRLANAVSLHDTRMLADPLRRQARALTVSALVAVVIVGGAFVMSVLKPGGIAAGKAVLADRDTNALYVRIDDQLHPVLNLASARLILGKPEDPAPVKPSVIDQFKPGNTVGIPEAPTRMSQSAQRDSRWLVCDAVSGPQAGATVIAGDPVEGSGHAGVLPAGTALLVRSEEDPAVAWLVWDNKRARIDVRDNAVASAVGIGLDTPAPRAMNRALLNLIPETAPLAAPFVANAGDPPRFGWPGPGAAPVIGSVVVDHDGEALRYWLVAADGLQPISPVIAAMMRAKNSYGMIEPLELTPDQIAQAPQVRAVAVEDFPTTPLRILDPVTDPVSCGQWDKLEGAPTSTLVLLAGQSLPVAGDAAPVQLAEPSPTTAARVVMPRGSGFYVQVTGQQPESVTKEQTFWVSDLGVRYGLEDSPGQPATAAAALGLTGEPLPIPWAVLSLMQPGPALSKADALMAH